MYDFGVYGVDILARISTQTFQSNLQKEKKNLKVTHNYLLMLQLNRSMYEYIRDDSNVSSLCIVIDNYN